MLLALAGLPGCYLRQAYYVSPFNGNTNDYHNQPTLRDSARSAIFVNGTYFTGQANDDHTDTYKAFHTEIYRSHHGKFLQGYYGLDLTLGDFATGRWDTVKSDVSNADPRGRRYGPPLHASELNEYAGHRFFGGTGFNGGINLVIPIHHGEWRYFGLETSLQREFGDYLGFRKHLSDTLATLVARNNFYGTLGFSSEILWNLHHGELGLRLATGSVMGRDYNNVNIYNNSSHGPLRFHYTTFSFHFTNRQYTGFFQANFATKSLSAHFGFTYRLNRPRVGQPVRKYKYKIWR